MNFVSHPPFLQEETSHLGGGSHETDVRMHAGYTDRSRPTTIRSAAVWGAGLCEAVNSRAITPAASAPSTANSVSYKCVDMTWEKTGVAATVNGHSDTAPFGPLFTFVHSQKPCCRAVPGLWGQAALSVCLPLVFWALGGSFHCTSVPILTLSSEDLTGQHGTPHL